MRRNKTKWAWGSFPKSQESKREREGEGAREREIYWERVESLTESVRCLTDHQRPS